MSFWNKELLSMVFSLLVRFIFFFYRYIIQLPYINNNVLLAYKQIDIRCDHKFRSLNKNKIISDTLLMLEGNKKKVTSSLCVFFMQILASVLLICFIFLLKFLMIFKHFTKCTKIRLWSRKRMYPEKNSFNCKYSISYDMLM